MHLRIWQWHSCAWQIHYTHKLTWACSSIYHGASPYVSLAMIFVPSAVWIDTSNSCLWMTPFNLLTQSLPTMSTWLRWRMTDNASTGFEFSSTLIYSALVLPISPLMLHCYLDQITVFISAFFVIKGGVSRRPTLQLIIEICHHFCKWNSVLHHHTCFIDINIFQLLSSARLSWCGSVSRCVPQHVCTYAT